MNLSVGEAIAAARDRAEQRRMASSRRVRVRILTHYAGHDDGDGLAIVGNIAARNDNELEAQVGLGLRRVPWTEVDRRAGELVALVDEVADEIEQAVARASGPIELPSKVDGGEGGLIRDFDDVVANALSDAARSALTSDSAKALSRAEAMESTMSAALQLAALCAFVGNFKDADVEGAWKFAVKTARLTASEKSPRLKQPRRFDA